MILFVAWPTANVPRSNKAARRWMEAGYKVAVATDLPRHAVRGIDASVPPLLIEKWEGYYNCMNFMARALCAQFRADIVVCAGDGIAPDPLRRGHDMAITFAAKFPSGFGAMQPVKGMWKPSASGGRAQPGMSDARRWLHATPATNQRCESPWLGRRFILEARQEGPYSGKYGQYFGDVELFRAAQRLGALWLRDDVEQPSQHWAQAGGPEQAPYQAANYDRHYEKDYAMFRAREHAGFPDDAPPVPAGANGQAAEPRRIILPGEF